jgi:acylphosphatase
MPRISVIITGKVQAVFFRVYAKECADVLDITGTIKNKENGSVEVEAQHFSEDVLKKYIELLQGGSSLSHVERVDVEWSEAEEEKEYFEILY